MLDDFLDLINRFELGYTVRWILENNRSQAFQ